MAPLVRILTEYGKFGGGIIPFEELTKAALPVDATSEVT